MCFRFCSLADDPEERHAMNQSILYNHGKWNIFSFFLPCTKLSLGKVSQEDGQ